MKNTIPATDWVLRRGPEEYLLILCFIRVRLAKLEELGWGWDRMGWGWHWRKWVIKKAKWCWVLTIIAQMLWWRSVALWQWGRYGSQVWMFPERIKQSWARQDEMGMRSQSVSRSFEPFLVFWRKHSSDCQFLCGRFGFSSLPFKLFGIWGRER